MSVKETTPVMRMQTAQTPLDHMYAIVSLDILEMDKIAQVIWLHQSSSYACWLHNRATARRIQK